MRKVVLIPTYWSRERNVPWQEGDAVYDHPTPINEEGTLQRTLESMKILESKDFKLVLLICPTTPEIEKQAEEQVVKIVQKSELSAETYLFTLSDLERVRDIFQQSHATSGVMSLLNMNGYGNVRNMCLLVADILAADVAILIDDDEIFEISDFIERATEFVGKRVYGNVVHGVAGYYLNKHGQYYDDVKFESWMTYWDRFGAKTQAFDEIIGRPPRIKKTPFAFGGAMVIHKGLFQCVPFDPDITRGEDIDYLINSRMYGFSFFLDNTLSIKHLPVPKKHPQWKRIREDIYRFVYERAKIKAQYKTSNMYMVSAEDFDPYPGEFLREDLEEKIFRSNMMLAIQYMMQGDEEGCKEALNNIAIAKREARPDFDPFVSYQGKQTSWEQLTRLISQKRYSMRKILEEHNLSMSSVIRDTHMERELSDEEKDKDLRMAFPIGISDKEWDEYKERFFVKTYYENEMVFQSGDYNDTLYVVLKGEIVLLSVGSQTNPDEEYEVARLNKGDVLGESCLSYKTFVLAGRAEQFTELIGIKERDILEINSANPAFGLKLYQHILAKASGKIRNENRQKTSLASGIVKKDFIDDSGGE